MEREREVKRMQRKREVQLIVMSVVISLGLNLLFMWASTEYRSVKYAQRPVRPSDVERLVRQGDQAFRDYRYDVAGFSYEVAARDLAEVIQFEHDSPSQDITRLQHYYNTETLLKARIELVLIAEEISHLENSQAR